MRVHLSVFLQNTELIFILGLLLTDFASSIPYQRQFHLCFGKLHFAKFERHPPLSLAGF